MMDIVKKWRLDESKLKSDALPMIDPGRKIQATWLCRQFLVAKINFSLALFIGRGFLLSNALVW